MSKPCEVVGKKNEKQREFPLPVATPVATVEEWVTLVMTHNFDYPFEDIPMSIDLVSMDG